MRQPLPVPSGRFCAFGKIPARADFITRGLPPPTRRVWDDWVQSGMGACQRIYGEGWQKIYAQSPIWHVYLSAQVSGAAGLIGIMLPGYDSVGRGYPLLLGAELPQAVDPLSLIGGAGRWFAAIEALALDALDPQFDPEELGRRVLPRWQSMELPDAEQGAAVMSKRDTEGLAVPLPMASAAAPLARRLCGADAARNCIFWTVGTATMPPMLVIMPRLVAGQPYVALLDGNWRAHGWRMHEPSLSEPVRGSRQAQSDDFESWDRDG